MILLKTLLFTFIKALDKIFFSDHELFIPFNELLQQLNYHLSLEEIKELPVPQL